jgi:hypothetical protein
MQHDLVGCNGYAFLDLDSINDLINHLKMLEPI